MIPTDTLERPEAPTKRPPGLDEYEARCAIRNLIELYGAERAAWMLSWMLEDERERAKR